MSHSEIRKGKPYGLGKPSVFLLSVLWRGESEFMYMMYVDESGDPGKYIEGGNSKHYILSGLIVDDKNWSMYLDRLKKIRNEMFNKVKLSVREEIHAAELIRVNKIDAYRAIHKNDRILILKVYSLYIPRIFNLCKVINICFDKTKVEVGTFNNYSELAWNRLIQRYDTFLSKESEKGLIFTDDTDEPLVRNLLRRMRKINYVSSHFSDTLYNNVIENIVEDPILRNSKHSYFIQTVDVISHLLYRKEYPKGSLKKYNLHNYFNNIEPILLKEASKNDSLGIVRK